MIADETAKWGQGGQVRQRQRGLIGRLGEAVTGCFLPLPWRLE